MKSRMNRADFHKLAPEVRAHLGPLNQAAIDAGGIEKSLIELVKIRASQINGCAFCLDMHTREARKLGETEERLHVLAAWHESPAFTDRERGGAGLDRLPDRHRRRPCPRRGLRRDEKAVIQEGAGLSDRRRRGDQRLEPDRRRLPLPARRPEGLRRLLKSRCIGMLATLFETAVKEPAG